MAKWIVTNGFILLPSTAALETRYWNIEIKSQKGHCDNVQLFKLTILVDHVGFHRLVEVALDTDSDIIVI